MARPSEIKAVAAVLMEPAEDVNDVAKQVIQALDQARAERVDYIACVQAGGLANGYGPYATYKQAEKAIVGGKLPALDGSRMFIMPLRTTAYADSVFASLDDGGMSDEAKKMWEIGRNGGRPAKVSKRRGRQYA